MNLNAVEWGVVRTNQTYARTIDLAEFWTAQGRPSRIIFSAGAAFDDPAICLLRMDAAAVSCGRAGAVAVGAGDLALAGGRLHGKLLAYQATDLGAESGYRSIVASQLAAGRVAIVPAAALRRTWWQASLDAYQGRAVRRLAWTDAGRSVVFLAGAGTTRAVAVVSQTNLADSVAATATFGAAEFLASDWVSVDAAEQLADLSEARLEVDLRCLDDDFGFGDPLAANITWHLWVDRSTPAPGGGAEPSDPSLPPSPPDLPEGFAYRRADGSMVYVPAKDCSGNVWRPA